MEGTLLLLVACLAAALIIRWRWRQRNLLKGPPSWPFIGATPSHILNLHRFHDYITDYSLRFGTFIVAYPTFNYIYTTNPANVEHMLKTNFNNYAKGKFMHDVQQEVLGDGIFSVDGMEWKQQRKIASYEFASKHLKDFCERAFIENAVKLADYLVLHCHDGSAVDMQDVFLRLLFDSYCKLGLGLEMSILGRSPQTEHLAFVKAFDNCNAMMFVRYTDPLWKLQRWLKVGKEAQFAKDVTTLDSIVYSFIAQRRNEVLRRVEHIDEHDILSRFISAGKDDSKQYTDRQIRDIVLNFMLAGRDTTALTLSWFLYCICKNMHVQEKLVEELLLVEPDSFNGRQPTSGLPSESEMHRFAKLLTYERLSRMPYLHACILETLRLYPPVPLDMRVALGKDVYPDGMVVSKGDYVVVAVYSMGRMPALWGEDAEEFKPERFINKDGVCEQQSPFRFPAFWAGPRMCLGKDFALLQMKVTLAILLRFFRFELVPGHKVQYKVMLTLHMSEAGIRVHVSPRF